jgi:K+-dependent Na+/Ca+ exchanger related-protein
MLIQILLLFSGLALVVYGADFLVDGASSIARKFGLSEFLIGLTIVGIGTSMPELVVSMTGAIQGNADIAIGNVVGSNIMNVLLILGVTALISPLIITKENLRKDIPLNIAASLLLIVMGMNKTLFETGNGGNLSMIEGFIFLAIFVCYLYKSFKAGQSSSEEDPDNEKVIKTWLAAVMVIGGIAGLAFGGRLFVNSACSIAKTLGLSDKFIAVTILAGGTSLPELVTCIVAAAKKKGQLALGNILGSNISNIFLILGCSAVFYNQKPEGPAGLAFSGMTMVDIGFFILSALLILGSAFTGKSKTRNIGRADGLAFLACEIAYMVYLFTHLNQ